MSIRRKKRKHTFPPWASCVAGGEDKRFVALPVSLLEHPSVLGLTSGAFRVYVYMKKHGDPKREFEIPCRAYSLFTDRKSFSRSVKELEAVGLIENTVHNHCIRKPNVYRFSELWKRPDQKSAVPNLPMPSSKHGELRDMDKPDG